MACFRYPTYTQTQFAAECSVVRPASMPARRSLPTSDFRLPILIATWSRLALKHLDKTNCRTSLRNPKRGCFVAAPLVRQYLK